MPVGQSQLWQVTLVGSVDGQNTVNVFHYRASNLDTTSDAESIEANFRLKVLAEIEDILSVDWTGEKIIVDELNGDDFGEFDLTTSVGQRPGQAMPPFVAASFILRRQHKDIRNGFKRFGPLSEDDVNVNAFTASWLAVAADVESALSAQLITGAPGGGNIIPCILRRAADYSVNYVWGGVTSASVRGVSSQVSRKPSF